MSAEARLTDRKQLIASAASENLIFYVVDKDDVTEHPDGSSFQVSKQELKAILGLDLLLNEKFVENPSYANIPAMLADQANQTPGKVQHVIDATADITVPSGYAYYEFLGPATGSLANYRKLSSVEVALLENNGSFNVFVTEDVSEALAETVAASKISFQFSGALVTKVLFNKVFTNHLKAFNTLIASKNLELVLYNKTKQKTLVATISSFQFSNGDNLYYEALIAGTMNKDDVAIDDTIEVKIDVSEKNTGFYTHAGYLVDSKGGVRSGIKSGYFIQGIGALVPGEFIMAIANVDDPADADDLNIIYQYLL